MASSFQFNQGYGAGPSNVDIGTGGGDNEFNFMNADITAALTPTYSSYPIAAGNYSYWVGIRGHWTSTFNSISNIYVWWTKVLTGYGTGADIQAAVHASWPSAPSATNLADPSAPTTQGTGLTPTYSSNYSQWTCHQLKTVNTAATPGDGGSSTLSLQWDES